MKRKNIVLLLAVLAVVLGTFAASHHVAPTDDTPPTTPTSPPATMPVTTVIPTATATATPVVISGGFVINDSMEPPPKTPVPEPSGNPVILSLQGPETVIVGDTFTISVMVNPNGRDVSGVQTSFPFNKDLVQVNSVTMGDEVDKDFSIPASIDNERGVIENIVGTTSPSAPFPKEEFIFAVINLTAKEPGDAELRLERNAASYAGNTETPILLPTKAEGKTIIIKTAG